MILNYIDIRQLTTYYAMSISLQLVYHLPSWSYFSLLIHIPQAYWILPAKSKCLLSIRILTLQ